MILAIDTSTAACTAALFSDEGECVASRDEVIGRGHSERLVPMVAELLEGRRAEHILVGVGPGSFTGIRVGIAAVHGLAIGWNAHVTGFSSIALLAAEEQGAGRVTAVVEGGHGELFAQDFDRATLEPLSALLNVPPAAAAVATHGDVLVGPGAETLAKAGASGRVNPAWPSARHVFRLPEEQRMLPPKPVYARAPDARARAA